MASGRIWITFRYKVLMMTNSEKIVEKWARLIMRKTGQDPDDEYKRLEIMNCMLICFKEMLD